MALEPVKNKHSITDLFESQTKNWNKSNNTLHQWFTFSALQWSWLWYKQVKLFWTTFPSPELLFPSLLRKHVQSLFHWCNALFSNGDHQKFTSTSNICTLHISMLWKWQTVIWFCQTHLWVKIKCDQTQKRPLLSFMDAEEKEGVNNSSQLQTLCTEPDFRLSCSGSGWDLTQSAASEACACFYDTLLCRRGKKGSVWDIWGHPHEVHPAHTHCSLHFRIAAYRGRRWRSDHTKLEWR